jgi:hypothetical protein
LKLQGSGFVLVSGVRVPTYFWRPQMNFFIHCAVLFDVAGRLGSWPVLNLRDLFLIGANSVLGDPAPQ